MCPIGRQEPRLEINNYKTNVLDRSIDRVIINRMLYNQIYDQFVRGTVKITWFQDISTHVVHFVHTENMIIKISQREHDKHVCFETI